MQESSTTTKSNIDSAVESGNNVTQASDIVRIPSITRLALAQQKQIISLPNHDINKQNNVIDNVEYPSSYTRIFHCSEKIILIQQSNLTTKRYKSTI